MNRKEWKKNARQSVKKHYLLFVFLCLLIGMMGLDFSDSLSPIKTVVEGGDGLEHYKNFWEEKETGKKESDFQKVFGMLIEGKVDEGEALASISQRELSESERKLGVIAIGHSRGVLSSMVNMTASGEVLTVLMNALRSMLSSEAESLIVFIFLSLLFLLFVKVFVFQVIHIAYKRFYMEARIYEKVPVTRFLFLLRVRKWFRVARTMLRVQIYQVLWSLTIIGGIIKSFSYFLVPYIVAENPSIRSKEAITLSRKMMKGHKWECFKMKISFIGWDFLDYFTLGVSGIFYANPYQEATYAEYYAYVRKKAIENNIPGSELLNDVYLYEKAEPALLEKTYADVVTAFSMPELPKKERHRFVHLLSDFFGVVLLHDEAENYHEKRVQWEESQKEYREIVAGEQYPGRLSRFPETKKVKQIEHLNYLRHYSIPSVILMFFSFCLIGWLWEVSLHLVSDGEFVNRGVLHGPWLPIYGTGGVLILLILNKLRKKPMVQFVAAVVLCGALEYSTSWYLEMSHDGQKWWDYSGYFMNIDGRICAEGLLVFGLGGLAIVYLAAPMLDNLFRKIPLKIAIPICAVLLVSYGIDQVYSSKHPNAGKGITDYAHLGIEKEIIQKKC